MLHRGPLMLLCSGKLLEADFRSQLREAHQRCADVAVIVAVVRKVTSCGCGDGFATYREDTARRYTLTCWRRFLEVDSNNSYQLIFGRRRKRVTKVAPKDDPQPLRVMARPTEITEISSGTIRTASHASNTGNRQRCCAHGRVEIPSVLLAKNPMGR